MTTRAIAVVVDAILRHSPHLVQDEESSGCRRAATAQRRLS
jgi:hypothetical protein